MLKNIKAYILCLINKHMKEQKEGVSKFLEKYCSPTQIGYLELIDKGDI